MSSATSYFHICVRCFPQMFQSTIDKIGNLLMLLTHLKICTAAIYLLSIWSYHHEINLVPRWNPHIKSTFPTPQIRQPHGMFVQSKRQSTATQHIYLYIHAIHSPQTSSLLIYFHAQQTRHICPAAKHSTTLHRDSDSKFHELHTQSRFAKCTHLFKSPPR